MMTRWTRNEQADEHKQKTPSPKKCQSGMEEGERISEMAMKTREAEND